MLASWVGSISAWVQRHRPRCSAEHGKCLDPVACLVGIDSTDADFDTVEETRGAKTVTLTSAESGVPAHSHAMTNANSRGIKQFLVIGRSHYPGPGFGIAWATGNNTASDAASAHNNIQPSIVVRMWKRTA